MKIYTKTGDKGKTSLLGGTRVSKFDLRIEAYGTIDELNAWIGILHSAPENEMRKQLLEQIQNLLFSAGSHLAAESDNKFPLPPGPDNEEIEHLEQAMDEMEKVLPQLRNFILPGGNMLVAHCHVARTVCRRAERRLTELAENTTVDPLTLMYLNRLSDYLFMLGRMLAFELHVPEIIWKPKANKN